MDPVEDVISKATSSKTPLEDVLRSCMVLASRLNHEPLKTWTHNELNGYPAEVQVPDYRIIDTQIRYPRGSFITSSDLVDLDGLSPDLVQMLRQIPMSQGIAELEGIHKAGGVKYSMPSQLNQFVGEVPGITHALTTAHREVSSPQIQAVLSSVRNRVLEFALSIQSEGINSEEPTSVEVKASQREIDRKFSLIIMGNSNTVAVAESSFVVQKIENQITQNDLASLQAFLLQQGVPESDVEQLAEVIEASSPDDLDNPKSALGKWIDKAAKSISGGGKDLLQAAAREAILLSVRYYFGEVAEGAIPPKTG